jgi:hypothetical protein
MTNVAARPGSTFYRTSLRVNGASGLYYDHASATQITLSSLSLTSGYAGILHYTDSAFPAYQQVRRAFYCTDWLTSVVGPESAVTAEVRTSGDVVLATASLTAGSGSVDMTQVALENAKKLVLLDAGSNVVDSYTATGDEIIEPGETYVSDVGSGVGRIRTLNDINTLNWL